MSPSVGTEALQALAWAYLESGQVERAEPLLAKLEREFEKLEQQGLLFFQILYLPYGYALNAASMSRPWTGSRPLLSPVGAWSTYTITIRAGAGCGIIRGSGR